MDQRRREERAASTFYRLCSGYEKSIELSIHLALPYLEVVFDRSRMRQNELAIAAPEND